MGSTETEISLVTLSIPGKPVSQGSLRAFSNKAGKAWVVQGGSKERREKLANWRQDVQAAARNAMKDRPPAKGAVQIEAQFLFGRPKTHFGTGRNASKIKESAPHDHIQSPDVDKLSRALLDSLTGIVFADDNQVILVTALKRWARPDEEEKTEVRVLCKNLVGVARLVQEQAHRSQGQQPWIVAFKDI